MYVYDRLARPLRWGAALALALQACTASLLQGSNGTSSGGATAGSRRAVASTDHLPEASPCTSQAPPPRAIRRLTRVELNNTLVDLFADPAAPQSQDLFGNDASTYGFADMQEMLSVRDNTALALSNFAGQVGTYAEARASTLWPQCQTTEPACLSAFVAGFCGRAFRRPATAAEVDALTRLAQASDSFGAAVRTVVTATLQMPQFLYRFELGTLQGPVYVLSPWEVASELSYLLTASMPDDELRAAAAANALSTPAQLEAQASRLMAAPRAKEAIDAFFLQWLQVSALSATARSEGTEFLTDAMKADMAAEARALIEDVVFGRPGPVSELFARDQVTLTPALAQFYGSPQSGTVAATAAGRAPGVLGLGAVLSAASQATYASPTLRGRMVRMRLLCGSVPVPPPGVPPLGEAAGLPVTLRQRLTSHTTNSSCASCHNLLDPLGFALGRFDTIGRTRAGGLENGQAVDANGSVFPNVAGAGMSTQVVDAQGLGSFLAGSPQAQDCLLRHWSMYAFGHLSWPEDSCTFEQVAGAARKRPAATVAEALRTIVLAPGFTQRAAR